MARPASRCALVVCALAVAAAATSGSAHAAAATCGRTAGLLCSVVEVPVDRAGLVAGTIPLHVEMLPSIGAPRGVVFLVAGGPGQGSAQTYDLGDPSQATFFRFLFPGYTLVAYDDRGTGGSNPLACDSLDSAGPASDEVEVVADCAAELGPSGSFYSTADHAADLDAVREALGFDRIAILGVSYGTKLALTYASTYPAHVDRLVLDSVVAPGEDSSFSANVLQALPGTLARFCANGACASSTSDFAGDVVAVANELAVSPLEGSVTALTFLGMVVDADLNPGLAAELPAAVHAARTGDGRPLLHALRLESDGPAPAASTFSSALYLATVCDDGPFPWLPSAAPADRLASIEAVLAALPPGSLGPFGSWAAGLGNAWSCAGWPAPQPGVDPSAGAFPDVPVLAFSGGFDLRTPTADAAAVVARFPQGHLVVVPGVGHSVLTMDTSLCSQIILRAWIERGSAPSRVCRREQPYVAPLAAFPHAPAKRLSPTQTRSVAAKTLREAEAAWLATAGLSGRKARLAGIHGGTLSGTGTAFTLDRYSIATGVQVSGRIRVTGLLPPLRLSGSLQVRGTMAARGTLSVRRDVVRGRLGNVAVGP
jgi:pimeloyl-ACP methyl ester carboxylesterase